jgi:DNA polymerase-3 subunit epsilon
MKLKLTRPLAIFDIEATGLNISKDRIVEIAIIKVHPSRLEETFTTRINPEMEIPAEVTEIHGISQEEIKDSPTFEEIAPRLIEFIGDADLAGYNSNKFDIPMLAEEFLRVNISFDLASKKFVDVQNIFHKMEQRTLSAAYQFYCNQELINSHNAFSDTHATWEVLKAQLEKYENLQTDVDFLADFSKGGNLNLVDFAGRLALNEKNEVVYNFGKHKGKSIEKVHQEEPGYYGWFTSETTDFPKYTKMKLKEEMEKIKSKGKIDHHTKPKMEPNKNPSNKSIDTSQLEALKAKFGNK